MLQKKNTQEEKSIHAALRNNLSVKIKIALH